MKQLNIDQKNYLKKVYLKMTHTHLSDDLNVRIYNKPKNLRTVCFRLVADGFYDKDDIPAIDLIKGWYERNKN